MDDLGRILPHLPHLPATTTPSWSSGEPNRSLPELAHLERLLDTPSTARLEQAVAQAEARLVEAPPLDWAYQRRLKVDLANWRTRLALGQERDQLQLTRPAGCWCLGLGGRGRYDVTPAGAQTTVYAFTRYCPCPAGDQAQAAAMIAELTTEAQTRPERVAEKVARLGLEGPELPGFTLESFPLSAATAHAHAVLTDWVAGGDYSVLLYGIASRGKTGLCIGALQARVRAEVRGGYYIPLTELFFQMRQRIAQAARDEDGDLEDVYLRCRSVPYLLLDDLGKESERSAWANELLFGLINHRYTHRRPTLFTSNEAPDELARRLGQPLVDRILQMCGPGHILKLGEAAPNLRTGDA